MFGSGRVIAHEDAFQRWYPASLTKIMTAYLAFSAIKVRSDEPGIRRSPCQFMRRRSRRARCISSLAKRFPLDSALKYLMVKSANDVAVAIAEAVSGSEEAFVRDMNATAKALGMQATRFVNPNGLPGSGQYTTARDMAVLAVAARRNFPEYAQYFGYEGFAAGKQVHTNYNLLIGRFRGADGMKTGFICASGFNQVSSATRNGKTVVSVVLGASSQEERAELSAGLLQAALTTAGSDSSTLANMKPYGEGRDRVADISGSICTAEARAARYEGRDVEGKMVLNSPYLIPMEREARLVPAPAGLPRAGVEVALSRVPIPVPRPGRTLSGQAEPFAASAFTTPVKPAEVMPLRPTVPIPVPRPQI
jgi:D-alanyl-D-alanine carboxypeptidase